MTTEKNLIMPKQTGQLDAFIASLKLFYESYKKGEEWYSNNDFKIKIQRELPYLSDGAQNGPYLVKQSELTRYFGLAIYDYSSSIGKTHITREGINFYEAYLANNKNLQIDIIMDSIFNKSFIYSLFETPSIGQFFGMTAIFSLLTNFLISFSGV